jgi:hypothetical protein
MNRGTNENTKLTVVTLAKRHVSRTSLGGFDIYVTSGSSIWSVPSSYTKAYN